MASTTLAIGAMAPSGSEVCNLGDEHPSRPGLVLVHIDHDGEIVTSADVQPGFLHRGVEKLFEVRDYRSVLMLADRHDWQASFLGELCIALTCEEALGLVAPPRATQLRVILAELARAHSHAAFLTVIGTLSEDGSIGEVLRDFRDQIRELFADISGNRVHPMLNRLGGVASDADDAWLARVATLATRAADISSVVTAVIAEVPGLEVGVLSGDDVDAFGLSGPVSAASGRLIDDRTTSPLYAALTPPRLPDVTTGDARARLLALASDLAHSGTLLREALDDLPDGPVAVRLSKIIKVPEQTLYRTIAAPWGTAGCYLVSRGDRTPWRLGLRTPTFANCSALSRALVGAPVSAVGPVVASLGYGIGDLDR